ncbi:peroxiredoxin-like 2A [Salvia divinorum]|uniref:Peroxiredoxin-like 2A n=1 Tax=Salvia divinorum TaxID=28513 RepID=A0ABD1H438_SALDI
MTGGRSSSRLLVEGSCSKTSSYLVSYSILERSQTTEEQRLPACKIISRVKFIERNFGDWAPLPEVIDICARIQSTQNNQLDSTKTLKEESKE